MTRPNYSNHSECERAFVPAILPKISAIAVTEDTMSIDIEDGRTISVPIGWFPRLAHGSSAERANFRISSGGYGVFRPDLDEDIGIEGLLLGKKSTESPSSFRQWLRNRERI